MLHTRNLIATILVLNTITLSSCLTYKDIVNFQDGKNLGNGVVDSIAKLNQVRLKTDDIVQVVVSSYNREEADRFNQFTIQGSTGSTTQQNGVSINDPFGYRIDSHGNIEMPVIGQINVVGLTMEEMRDKVYQKIEATGYLKTFSVQTRFLSFRISILGEVNNPGTYNISSQKVTLLEALGLARDVNLFSKRDNILVIREKDGVREYGRVNLKTKDFFKSPYYYLQPNDIVYVEPHRAKILAAPDPASRYVSTVIALVSLVLLILR